MHTITVIILIIGLENMHMFQPHSAHTNHLDAQSQGMAMAMCTTQTNILREAAANGSLAYARLQNVFPKVLKKLRNSKKFQWLM